MFNTSILFLIFNRPDTTNQVFAKIREIKPTHLYIAADGPRLDRGGEVNTCELTKKIVLDSIDWDCEVKTLFRKENLGCGLAVSSAITWFFDNVEEGIILEDDCLPDLSFFFYCEKLLNKFRFDDKIMHISGHNILFEKNNIIKNDIFFSKMCHIWGWATWRRAWESYDFSIYNRVDLEKIIDRNLTQIRQKSYYKSINKKLVGKIIDTWDYQWLFSIWSKNGISINPKENRVRNIGFNEFATHTGSGSKFSLMKYGVKLDELNLDLDVIIHYEADCFSFECVMPQEKSFILKLKSYLFEILSTVKKKIKC